MSEIKEDTMTLDEILQQAGITSEYESSLVLWNDDHNSFEWVIFCLVTLLEFTPEKAEQSAWTVHLSGKDVIKKGSRDALEPYKKLLEERGLTVSIED
jgi:ATP-dependent Clp protease adaptor protein ClpS